MKKIWIEYLRVLAVFAVITIHATATTYNEFGHIPINDWWVANILSTFSRFSVPMFVMISGCVLLGRNYGVKDFYIKRGTRLLPALLFWTLFYIAFDYVFNDKTLSSILWKLTAGLVITGKAHYHLWYLSMFLCLMLFAPFINSYIVGKKPTLENFIYMFFAFMLFLLLNQVSSIAKVVYDINMNWFKVFPWYIGYFVAGYFINAYHDKINVSNKAIVLTVVCLLVGSGMLNYYSASTLGIVKDSFVLTNVGILNFIITVSIFLLFSKNGHVFSENKIINNIAAMSFGIYLIHPVFIVLLREKINYFFNGQIVGLPLLIIATFVFSYLTIAMLTKMKWFKALC